jgi:methionyl-tRNA synthetase
MIAKNCDGKVPEPGALTNEDNALLAATGEAIDAARAAMARQHVHDATAAIWAVIGEANRYFAAQEPWALKKTDSARMATVLYVTAETVRRMSIAVLAFVPDSAGRILDALAVPADNRLLAFAGDSGTLAPGTALPAPSPVFQRFERETTE